MGERGIERPVWRPQGTKFAFFWPQGVNRRQRDFLARMARREAGSSSGAVRWLQRNAWRHLGPRPGVEQWLLKEPDRELDEGKPDEDGGGGADNAPE